MSADIVEFNVKCTMRADWAATFISMLKRMQYLGAIGSSRYMAFYADGAEHAKFYTPDRPIKVEALYDAG